MAKKRYKDGGMKRNMMEANGGPHANMPQESKVMVYPDPYYDETYNMKDSIEGIDEQIKADCPSKKPGYKPAHLN